MFSDLDETIRQLLIREGGFAPSEIDISFEIPDREWSAGISRPTLNCYLFDIRENRDLQQTGMQSLPTRPDGSNARRRPPFRLDLTYLLTAWTRQVEDEHRLLWHAFTALFRFSALPADRLQGDLLGHGQPIYASVAHDTGVLKSPGDFWTALENQIKPSLTYVLTLAVERDLQVAGPPVTSRATRITRSGPADEAAERGVNRESAAVVATAYQIRGTVKSAAGVPQEGVTVAVGGRAREGFTTGADGVFVLRNLSPGPLTLLALRGEQEIGRLETSVPAADYSLVVTQAAARDSADPT
jgi:hypothetical protein